jgi:molybdopterin-guanine dinucleotide biosynthesis protein A
MIAGVVLAGGGGRRMGGLDKAALTVGGVTLLDRVLGAARPVCERLLVVGPERPTAVAGVTFVPEAEPGGGPGPAVLAGVLAAPRGDVAVVLATDLPLLRTDHLRRLLAALDGPTVEAAAAADKGGPNPLLAAYRVDRLVGQDVAPGSPAARLLPARTLAVDLGPATFNVNRPDDLAAAELLLDHDDAVVVTAQWLRALVTATLPDAVESVDGGGRGFGYRHPRAGPVCAVYPRDHHVQLSFEHGTHVDVRAPDDPRAPLLVELLDAAVGPEPRPPPAAILGDPGQPSRAVTGMSANYPDRYAEALGLKLTEQEVEAVLDLARAVAHGAERRFAPLSSYLAGQFVSELVRTGVPRHEALAEAAAIAERALAADE